jgi:hypothetical protein
MAMDVETKDCTALSDAELTDMADMCAADPANFDIGLLSKQRDLWVLVTQVKEAGKLQGFSFCTLERIGGTPSLLIGLASIVAVVPVAPTLAAPPTAINSAPSSALIVPTVG